MDMNTQTTAQPAPQGNPLPQAPASASATQTRYAGFWIRFAARLIDGLIVGAIGAVLFIALSMVEPVLGNTFAFIASFIYYIAMHGSSWQATVGKKVLGIRVIRADGSDVSYGRATGRSFAELISYLVFMIGYIMAAFTDQKKSLHDIICDTRVVYDTRKQQA